MHFDDRWPHSARVRAALDALAGDGEPPARRSVPGATDDRPPPHRGPLHVISPDPQPPAPRPDALRPEIALPSWRSYDPKALAGPRPYPWCPTPAACRVLIRNLGDPDRVPCPCREPDYRGPGRAR